ncbi:FecR domain-containing protein [Candidatus Poribacteria bacterium]|nr:FecR domain-containing protein [Candidatus Poribacteria bacterium]
MKACEAIQLNLHMYAEEQLASEEAREVQEHVAICELCSTELEEYREMGRFLRGSLAKKLTAPQFVDRVLDSPPEPIRRIGRLQFTIRLAGASLAVVAAMILLVAGGYLYSRGFIGPKPVAASLTHVSRTGGQWKKSERRIRGMTEVVTEARERRSLRLNNGVIVVLDEKTRLEIQSETSLKLLMGEVYIDTAGHKGIALRIVTDHATTYVTGTKLGVSTGADQTSIVVEEGRVTVESDWGDQVVVNGSIYRIIESMKPEPPKPVDVSSIFLWVRERAYLAGMMKDYYEGETETAAGESDTEALNRLLYGLSQSRNAISSGDVVFDIIRTDYGFGHDITDEEQKQFTEKVVAGHISLLTPEEAPDEERFHRMIEDAKRLSVLKGKPQTKEFSQHWIFRAPDKARMESTDGNNVFPYPNMVIRGNLRHVLSRSTVEQFPERAPIRNHPVFYGRSEREISELVNPRMVGMEEIDGVTSYLVEADITGDYDMMNNPIESRIRMWVDPSRGYIVLKTRTYAGFEEYRFGSCDETTAGSFEEVSPGVFYPRTYTRDHYEGDIFMGEKVLRKTFETVCTLREGAFNLKVADDSFAIPANLPVVMVDMFGRTVVDAAQKQAQQAEANEHLRQVYGELDQIKRYDDPTAPGSRKLVFQLSSDSNDVTSGIKSGKGGLLFGPFFYNGEPVATTIARVDPRLAPNFPGLQGDIIYTLNDEPWIVRGPIDVMRGLEGCIPIINAGKPITAGIRRNGELLYIIMWFDY